jgi:hypothetical protein
MSKLEKKIQTNLKFNFTEGDEYPESLSIREKMSEQKWEEAQNQLDELIRRLEDRQELDMDNYLMDLMVLVFTLKEEEIQDGQDRENKVRAYSKCVDDIAYLMCLQPKFTKEYLIRKCWQEALESAKYVYQTTPERKIEYDLTWEDVFEYELEK